MKRTPTEIKVVFEREEKEYEAEIIATDKKVNLAFLKVKDLEGREVSVVDFDAAVKADLGAMVAAVSRLTKGYDYSPYVRTAYVSGSIKKPRKALMLDGSVRSEGLPVFTMSARTAPPVARCSRQTRTGAAQKRLRVKTPATLAPLPMRISRRSLRPGLRMPASAHPRSTPGTACRDEGSGGARLTAIVRYGIPDKPGGSSVSTVSSLKPACRGTACTSCRFRRDRDRCDRSCRRSA